jgi:hypothetical protein
LLVQQIGRLTERSRELVLYPKRTKIRQCRTKPGTKRRRQAGNVRLPRLHAHQREEWIRAIHGAAHHDRKRMRAKLRQVKQQLRQRMHDPVPQTGQWLKSVVQGYFNYYAVPGNWRVWRCFGIGCWRSGGELFADGARNAGSLGRASSSWLSDGFLNRERSIPFLTLASPPLIRDKNRMR